MLKRCVLWEEVLLYQYASSRDSFGISSSDPKIYFYKRPLGWTFNSRAGKKCRGSHAWHVIQSPTSEMETRSEWMGSMDRYHLRWSRQTCQIVKSNPYLFILYYFGYILVSVFPCISNISISRQSFQPVEKGILATSDYTAPSRSAEECRLVGKATPMGGRNREVILRFWRIFRVLRGSQKGPIYIYILYIYIYIYCI